VYDDEKVLTPLRFPDELVRHKILDIIGDLALAGRIKGHVIAVKSSHAINTALAKKIVEDHKNK
jgi:UDP-3-O-[3-hydroxymyristoyl] N-acetylglucosamine deacetylase